MNRIEKVREIIDEILKDADVMQHILCNPFFEIKQHEKSVLMICKESFP